MKERPILFSGEMVRAILEGRKTQTRRVVKPQPFSVVSGEWVFCASSSKETPDVYENMRCPYGHGGDRLWVKETWATSEYCDNRPPRDMEKPGFGYGWPVWYSADGSVNLRGRDSLDGGVGFTTKGKLRPSIFMPRWASRTNLEIKAVRVERLQDISGKDAIVEGVLGHGGDESRARTEYMLLWDSINGKTYPWSSNPWVWVIQFKQV